MKIVKSGPMVKVPKMSIRKGAISKPAIWRRWQNHFLTWAQRATLRYLWLERAFWRHLLTTSRAKRAAVEQQKNFSRSKGKGMWSSNLLQFYRWTKRCKKEIKSLHRCQTFQAAYRGGHWSLRTWMTSGSIPTWFASKQEAKQLCFSFSLSFSALSISLAWGTQRKIQTSGESSARLSSSTCLQHWHVCCLCSFLTRNSLGQSWLPRLNYPSSV